MFVAIIQHGNNMSQSWSANTRQAFFFLDIVATVEWISYAFWWLHVKRFSLSFLELDVVRRRFFSFGKSDRTRKGQAWFCIRGPSECLSEFIQSLRYFFGAAQRTLCFDRFACTLCFYACFVSRQRILCAKVAILTCVAVVAVVFMFGGGFLNSSSSL